MPRWWPPGAGEFSNQINTRRSSRGVPQAAGRRAHDTTFHKLRHYNAAELIAAGADVRTVAEHLGHGGGGSTTLRGASHRSRVVTQCQVVHCAKYNRRAAAIVSGLP